MNALRLGLLAFLLLGTALVPLAGVAQTTVSHEPNSLQLSMLPSQVPADGRSYPALVISLLDARGQPTLSLTDVLVYLSTTNSTVASVPETVTLPAGHSYLQVDVATSTKTGSVTLGATSQGLASASVQAATVHPSGSPASLTLLLSPRSVVQSLLGPDDLYAVQLKNSAGQPALAAQDTSLVITSSNTTMLPGTLSANIPAGADLVYGVLSPATWGTATLTALSPQLGTGSAQLSVLASRPSVAVSFSPQTIVNGASASVQVAVQVLGMPVQGANVLMSASLGTLAPPFGATGADGVFTTVYASGGQGPATVNVTASSPVIGSVSSAGVLIVTAPPTTSTQAPTSAIPGLQLVTTYLPVIVVVVVVAVGFILVRHTLKKRRGTKEDDYAVAEEPGT
ncbi:MAG: hypothetical protein JRN57_01805 [Nitrososphaerota archaeon]|nr:hypothetical protein [Nitrososphaerota archaeon]